MQSPSDIPALRRLLSEIDDEMADLQAKLASLAAARKPILKTLQSVVYPVLTLPPEVTAQIFIHCVDTAHIGRYGPSRYPRAPITKDGGHGPLSLASVCRAWRDIALALGPIWSSYRLFTVENSLPHTKKLLQCWLPRAGVHPLEIDLEYLATTNALCTLLAPYSPQWRRFSCGMRTPISFPSHLIQGRLPMLRTLEIALQAEEDDPATQVTAFADAPQLREVHLIGCTLPWISLPWIQLTSLQLTGQDYTQCIEILHQTPNLETLNVDYPLSPAMSLPPVRLPHLQTLIVGRQSQMNDNFFEHLIFPALTHLELTNISDEMVRHFTSFLTRSACRLSSLTLIGMQLRTALDCLGAAPLVTVRTVRRVVDAGWNQRQLNHFFATLTRESATFLPNLRSLAVNPYTTAVEIPYVKLADLLAARRGAEGSGVARLDSLELVLAPSTPFPPG